MIAAVSVLHEPEEFILPLRKMKNLLFINMFQRPFFDTIRDVCCWLHAALYLVTSLGLANNLSELHSITVLLSFYEKNIS